MQINQIDKSKTVGTDLVKLSNAVDNDVVKNDYL